MSAKQLFRLKNFKASEIASIDEIDEITISVNNKKLAWVAKKIRCIVNKLLRTSAVISSNNESDISLHMSEGSTNTGTINCTEQIIITASTPNMVLHTAVNALIQLFLDDLAIGTTEVSYQQEERIVMLDMGRKYFSKETILKLIDSMCLAQFNYLQLHFSENEGFRIESNIAPEIVSNEFLTKNEIREIILHAQRSGIEIIPDFDSPGHLKQLLKHHPEWQLQKKSWGKLKKDDSALNICNPEAVEFVLSIYKEFAELFAESTYYHIGADEFVNFDEIGSYPELCAAAKEKFGESAEAIDCFVDYVNYISKHVRSWGFIPRVWNDGFLRLNRKETVKLSEDVEITYWTKHNRNMATLARFVERGFNVINFNDGFFYYVLGEHAGYKYPSYDKIIKKWTPSMFANDQEVEKMTSQFPGVALAIWCDVPDAKAEDAVWKEVSYLIFAMVQKLTGQVFMKKEDAGQILSAYFYE